MTIIREFELKQMVTDGHTPKEIAEILSCSVSSVNRAIKKLGIRPVYVVYNKEQYYRMIEMNMTDEDVAYVFGVSYGALRTWKSRNGITKCTTRKPHTAVKTTRGTYRKKKDMEYEELVEGYNRLQEYLKARSNKTKQKDFNGYEKELCSRLGMDSVELRHFIKETIGGK